MVIVLSIFCVFTFAALDWGGWGKKDTAEDAGSEAEMEEEAEVATESETVAEPDVDMESDMVTESETVAEDSMESQPTPPAATSNVSPMVVPSADQIKAMMAVMKVLGDGTPQEKQARLDSLTRLAQALAAKQQPKSGN